MTRACRRLLLASAAIAAAPAAIAQPTYRCVENGNVHFRDRPCDEARPLTSTTPSRPAHYAHMRPVCRRLAEQFAELAPTRWTRETVRERERIERERQAEQCHDDESRARRLFADELRKERERRAAEQQLEATQLAQCHEMRRIRDAKRSQRASMTDGERADFDRFEANFVARCQGVVVR